MPPPHLLRVFAISIHAPRAGSDAELPFTRRRKPISIHAPRAGSDAQNTCIDPSVKYISIHAPRAGSDRVVYGRMV